MPEKPPSEKNGKFDTGLIRELAAILREADLGEIEIEQGGLRIKVVKPETKTVYAASAPAHAAPAPAAAGSTGPAVSSAAKASAGDHPGAVKSPMVGTVYLQPDENSPTFVKPGDAVTEGQTLLLIEAMKTFNPVTAPRAGKVTQILVKNTQPVEFGEPLVIIE